MPSVHITPIEVYKAIRTIVAAMYSDDLAQTGKQPNSFAIIRNEGDLSGDTLNNRPEHYYTDLFYTRGYNGSGNMFAQFPRVVLQEFTAPSLDGGSAFDVALMCADLAHDNTIDASGLAVRHFKEVEENTRSILMAIYRNLLSWEKRISPDGTEVYFAPASQMTGAFASWRVRDTMQQVLRSNERVSFRRTIEGMFTQATAGNVMNLTLNIRNYECQQVAYANPCSGAGSVELDVNGETVTASGAYTLEILQDGELIGTGVLGENSGTWTIPPCPTPDPVTVTVNEAEFATIPSGDALDIAVVNTANTPVTVDITEAPKIILADTLVKANGVDLPAVVAGELVNFSVRNEANQNAGGYLNDHHWQIANANLSINGADVDTLVPEIDKALTVTLNGSATTPTYTAGVINVTTATPTGYCGLPLDVPAQNGVVVNTADTGAASLLGAYITPFPTGYAGYNSLDLTDATGSTLAQNNVLFGTKNRFTNLTGTANTYTAVNWLDGAGVTRTARCMIDHLYGVKGICLLLTDDVGRWSSEWPTRLNGATYSGTSIYPVSRGMLEALQRFDVSALNQLEAYMGHSGLVYSGEVPVNSQGTVYSMTGVTLGTTARTSNLKVLLFHQIP